MVGLRAQRWTDEHGVVHGWFVDNGFTELPRVTFCGMSLFFDTEENHAHLSFWPVRLRSNEPIYFDAAVTCIECMDVGALEL